MGQAAVARLLDIVKVLLGGVGAELAEPAQVGGVDQPVRQHALALVDPQPRQVQRLAEVLPGHAAEPLHTQSGSKYAT